jgi:hypothetical protein
VNQKDAVFQAIKDIRRGDVDTDKPIILTKQEKQVASQKLFDGFKKGRVSYKYELPSDDKLLMYISGLVSNWLRKDQRLNGQKNYVPFHPGPRSTIPVENNSKISVQQLEALRTLAGDDEEVQIFVVKRPAKTVEQIEVAPTIAPHLSAPRLAPRPSASYHH